MHFLYPSSPLKPKQPDDFYAEEMAAVQKAGFTASVVSLEDLSMGMYKVHPTLPVDATVLYRGWMLSTSDYFAYTKMTTESGAYPFSDLAAYLSTHHLPNWYPLLVDLTPQTVTFPLSQNIEETLPSLGWNAYFIKDYVKSLKTSIGSHITEPEQLPAVLQKMRQFRGTIEGGICVRKVEPFVPGSEKRYFVIKARSFAADATHPPVIVDECAARITSGFFSVDIVEREDGQLRVVEIGDGQVSDLVGWSVERFVEVCRASFT